MDQLWNVRMLASEGYQLRLPALGAPHGLPAPQARRLGHGAGHGHLPAPGRPHRRNSWKRWSSGSYGLVYSRTALVFHDLEQALGTELFEKAMALYFQRWRFRHPSTADLREAFVDAGADRALVERWFDEQVFANGPWTTGSSR